MPALNLTLRVHQRITLEARGPEGTLSAGATVREVRDDGVVIKLVEGAPSLAGLGPDDRVDVLVSAPSRVLRGEARVIEVAPAITITPPVEAVALQRRRFFRTRVAVPFSFLVVHTTDDQGAPLGAKARTLDLSGGGLRFESALRLTLDAQLELVLHLGQDLPLLVEGRVVWGERSRLRGPARFSYGVEFVDLPRKDRDRVICFLLARQGRAAVL
jgi:hypothetical protein